MNLSIKDAQLLFGGLSACIVPFVVAWLPTLKIPDYAKFGILCILSLIGGFLTVYISGAFDGNSSIISNGAVILAAAQAFYYIAFRMLGLEKVLFPRQAVSTQAKEQIVQNIPDITTETAQKILDPNDSTILQVSTTVTDTKR